MVRTGIPVSVWETEGDAVTVTAFDLLLSEARPAGVDLDDPTTIPQEWL